MSTSYTALYRKYRPTTFQAIKGQEHIVTTLENQVKTGRIGHAYLFCGTRGTGKTSAAKIFAKAVNCEAPVAGSPCQQCSMCLSIGSGASLNVMEIDAASNNGVDNIRDIREEVAYRPTTGAYKVYIIDEVHMLSTSAFNALLKTLEEPPEYVIFILATTEVHKIPLTILSRCQQYDFRRISLEAIAREMQEYMAAEAIPVEETALEYIAKVADGSMRDALSLLDQCVAFYLGQKLTRDNVIEMLGTVDNETFSRLIRAIVNGETTKALEIIEEMVINGRDLSQMTGDFTWYLRNLLIVKTARDPAGLQMENLLDVSRENLRLLREEAEKIKKEETLYRYIRIFSELSNTIKQVSGKRVMLEVAIIKLCRPEMEKDYDSLLERLRYVEERLERGMFTPAQLEQIKDFMPQGGNFKREAGSRENATAEDAKSALPPPINIAALPEEVKEVVQHFRQWIADFSQPMKSYLGNARLTADGDNRLKMVFQEELAYEYLNRTERKEQLEEVIASKLGKKVEIQMSKLAGGESFSRKYVDLEESLKKINFEITVEE